MYGCVLFTVSLVLCMSFRYDDKDYRPRFKSRLQFTKPTRNGVRPRLERGRRHDYDVYPSLIQRQNNKNKRVPTKMPDNPNPNSSVFPGIKSSHNGAIHVTDQNKYTFLGSVIHSPVQYFPHICSAAAVKIGVFITAARCIFQAKVVMTRVIYKGQALEAKAFVAPRYPTKQMFNDVGFIVVTETLEDSKWDTIPLYTFKKNDPKRQGEGAEEENGGKTNVTKFTEIGWLNATVLGYVVPDDANPQDIVHPLYEMQVVTSPFLCNYLYNKVAPNNDYFVPCYNACDLAEYYTNDKKCFNQLAGEGHIVIEEETKHLLGIATWSGYYKTGINLPPLPIGMAVPDTWAFLTSDVRCADKLYKVPPDLENKTKQYSHVCYYT